MTQREFSFTFQAMRLSPPLLPSSLPATNLCVANLSDAESRNDERGKEITYKPQIDGDKSVTVKATNRKSSIKSAGKPVSRILFDARAVRPTRRSDHSSRSRFAPGLQQPTRGS